MTRLIALLLVLLAVISCGPTSSPIAPVVTTPYRLRRPQPRVAVLADNAVASSGEATLIAFIKRPNTRTFGVATCGRSTANRGFPLSDGANLNLTTSVMADRAKQAIRCPRPHPVQASPA